MKQIAAFSYCESAEIVAEVLPVQQPANCVDCGLFAIAGATSLSHNQNLVRQVYGTTKLRQHLVSCLDARKMSVFSSHSTNEKKTSKQHLMLLKSTVHGECHPTILEKTIIWSDVLSVVTGTMVVVKISPL